MVLTHRPELVDGVVVVDAVEDAVAHLLLRPVDELGRDGVVLVEGRVEGVLVPFGFFVDALVLESVLEDDERRFERARLDKFEPVTVHMIDGDTDDVPLVEGGAVLDESAVRGVLSRQPSFEIQQPERQLVV